MDKERRGSVTVWLVIWITGSALGAIGSFIGISIGGLFGGNTNTPTILGILSIVNIVCFVLIFCWKFIGVVGIVVSSLAGMIINIAVMGKMGAAIDTVSSAFSGGSYGFSETYKWTAVISTAIFLLLFFSVLCKKKDGYSTWDYLVNESDFWKKILGKNEEPKIK
jgi:hypothetical protein